MKKILSVIMILALCITPMYALLALAEEENTGDALMLSGTLQAKTDVAIKAPVSGELLPFDVSVGDAFAQGDTLFEVEPQTVYAQFDGTVGAVYVQSGDALEAAISRYGAAMKIEYADRYEILCHTRNGYDSDENKHLDIGTPVYLREKYDTQYTATGEITAVNGSNFTVAIYGGDVRLDETINVYRDADYGSKSLLSADTKTVIAPYLVTGNGTVVDVMVSRGEEIQKGDALFTYVPDALEAGKNPVLTMQATSDWVVTTMNVSQGASVQKGQVLAMAQNPSDLEIVAMVEERDLAKVQVGQVFHLELEEVGMNDMTATVSSISPLGVTNLDVTEYQVTLNFESVSSMMIGMHATLER